MDGPLAGQVFRRRRRLENGRRLTVAELDVEHGVLAVDYRVTRSADRGERGLLHFVEARDVGRPRRGLHHLAGLR